LFIYKAIAQKNAIVLEDVQTLYAKKIVETATAGTPIEVLNEQSGAYEWHVKQ